MNGYLETSNVSLGLLVNFRDKYLKPMMVLNRKHQRVTFVDSHESVVLNRLNGFTILETTIVIAIMAILSTVMFEYNRSSEKQIVLYRDQAIIVGIINRAKSLALQKFNITGGEACAFGVHFDSADPDKFILFNDFKDTSKTGCKTDDAYNGNAFYDSDKEKIAAEQSEFFLDSRLQFSSIIDGGGTSLQKANIVFIPPELTIKATGSSGQSITLPLTIALQAKTGGAQTTIEIGAGGQIVEK